METTQTSSGPLPYSRIPEPPRRPLMGHLPDWLGVESAKRVLQRLQGYAEQCGPIARVSLGPVKMIVVSDARLAAGLLEDERANFKGATYILTRAVLDNVLLLNGAAWESHRKTYRQALKDVDVAGAANAVTLRHLERLLEGGSLEVRLDEVGSRLLGDVVAQFVAGLALDDDFEPHRRRIQYELAGIGIDLQCQPWKYLSPARWVELRRSLASARGFFRREVDRRLKAGDDGAGDIVSGFFKLARAGAYPLDASALQDGAVNFFFTAHDVLASSTTFCLYLLAEHPEIQSRLRAAIARIPEERLDPAALDEIDELQTVVRESLRLYPGYSLFGRTTQQELTVGEHRVPAGTQVIVSPYVTHRLERHFRDAARFVPERWAGATHVPIGPMARDQYMPFGSGARGCLASHLALPVMKIVVAQVVRSLELEARPGFEPKIAYWGTAYAENGLPVRIRRVAS